MFANSRKFDDPFPTRARDKHVRASTAEGEATCAEAARTGECVHVTGLIDHAMQAVETGVEIVMQEIASIAEQLDPVLSHEKAISMATAHDAPRLDVGEEDSVAAKRINDTAGRILEAARAIESLRRRIQL